MLSLKGHTREIVLFVGLVVLLFYLFKPAPPGAKGKGAGGEEAAADPVMALVRSWESFGGLEGIRTPGEGEQANVGRNLFDYGKPPPPPGPSAEELARLAEERARKAEADRLAREEAERLRREALQRQQEATRAAALNQSRDQKPVPPARPVPPSINLKYIGHVGEQNNEIAIFLDGTQFLLAREGEVVKEDFRVKKIGYDTLQMGFTDPRFADETRVLPMGK